MPIQEIMTYVISAMFTLVTSCVVIERTPIKLNPIRWLGKRFNSDMNETVQLSFNKLQLNITELDNKLKDLETNTNTNEIDRIRKEISDFSDSLRRGEKHTKSQFFRIVSVHEKYNDLLKKNHMTNGVIDTEYRYIDLTYQECLNNGTLLRE